MRSAERWSSKPADFAPNAAAYCQKGSRGKPSGLCMSLEPKLVQLLQALPGR